MKSHFVDGEGGAGGEGNGIMVENYGSTSVWNWLSIMHCYVYVHFVLSVLPTCRSPTWLDAVR